MKMMMMMQRFFKLPSNICKNTILPFYLMLHMLFVMVIDSQDKILVSESKDSNDNVNFTSETPTICPLCKSDNAIITDSKSEEVICSKCGVVVSDKIQDSRRLLNTEQSKHKMRTGIPTSLAQADMGLST